MAILFGGDMPIKTIDGDRLIGTFVDGVDILLVNEDNKTSVGQFNYVGVKSITRYTLQHIYSREQVIIECNDNVAWYSENKIETNPTINTYIRSTLTDKGFVIIDKEEVNTDAYELTLPPGKHTVQINNFILTVSN